MTGIPVVAEIVITSFACFKVNQNSPLSTRGPLTSGAGNCWLKLLGEVKKLKFPELAVLLKSTPVI